MKPRRCVRTGRSRATSSGEEKHFGSAFSTYARVSERDEQAIGDARLSPTAWLVSRRGHRRLTHPGLLAHVDPGRAAPLSGHPALQHGQPGVVPHGTAHLRIQRRGDADRGSPSGHPHRTGSGRQWSRPLSPAGLNHTGRGDRRRKAQRRDETESGSRASHTGSQQQKSRADPLLRRIRLATKTPCTAQDSL